MREDAIHHLTWTSRFAVPETRAAATRGESRSVLFLSHPAARQPGGRVMTSAVAQLVGAVAGNAARQPAAWRPADRFAPLPAAMTRAVTVSAAPAEWATSDLVMPLPRQAAPAPASRPALAPFALGRVAGTLGVDLAEPRPDAPPRPAVLRAAARSRRRLATMAAIAGVVLMAGAMAGALLSRARGSAAVEAAFNAPMMVLRAVEAGRVVSIAVKPGQKVDPATLLLTLQMAAKPDPSEAAARNRVLVAQRRMAAYDNAVSQPVAAGEASRQHLVGLFHARDAAAAELAAAQDVVAHLTAGSPVTMPVTAGAHGVVWSVELLAGLDAPAGAPLVRMVDCDHAFFTVKPGSGLLPGQPVEIELPNTPAVQATVRPASGVAEPPNALVVEPEPGAFAETCPLGVSGRVSPAKASG